jgi:hypothetical protein
VQPLEVERIEIAETAAEILKRFRIGNIWLYGTENVEEISGTSGTIITTVGTLNEIRLEQSWMEYGWQTAGTVRLGRLQKQSGETVLTVDGIYPVPYFGQLYWEHLIGGPVFARGRDVAINVSPTAIEFAVSVAVAIAARSERAVLLIAPDSVTASRIDEAIVALPLLRHRALIFDLNSRALYNHAIELMIDLAPDVPAFTLMVEYATSQGIPVLRMPIGAESFNGTAFGRSSGLRFLLQIVKAARDPKYRDELQGRRPSESADKASIEALQNRLGESVEWII